MTVLDQHVVSREPERHSFALAPRPPIETTDAPAPPHVDRRRALALMLGPLRTTGRDAGTAEAAVPPERPTPTRVSHGMEQGHGSERWCSSDAPERGDFEPRYSLDGGTLAEPPPVVAETSGAYHRWDDAPAAHASSRITCDGGQHEVSVAAGDRPFVRMVIVGDTGGGDVCGDANCNGDTRVEQHRAHPGAAHAAAALTTYR